MTTTVVRGGALLNTEAIWGGRTAVRCSLATIRRAVGYVPQTDVMLRELSVRDVVAHSANTRLAADVPSAARAEHVDATLRYMHL